MTTPTVARLLAYFEGLESHNRPLLSALAGAYGPLCGGGGERSSDPLKAAAFQEVKDRCAGFLQVLDLEIIWGIASGELDALALARHVLDVKRNREAHPDDPPEPPRWDALDKTLRQHLCTVAHRFMRVPSLEARHSDSLDFHTVDFASAREALVYAYFMGLNARNQD